jgi:hypothetical protein
MNERALRQLIRRVAASSIPWSVATLGLACSGSIASGGSPEGGSDATSSKDGSPPSDSGASSDALAADVPGFDAMGPDAAAADDASDIDATGQDDALGVDVPGQDEAVADIDSSDGPNSSDPCAPFPNFGGCGGGLNFCVVPDASTQALADGGQLGATCRPFCGPIVSCELVEVDAQQLVRCHAPCTGRRPGGLVAEQESPGADLAAYFGEVAYLEQASVVAFAVLRNELRHHRAPRSLVRAAGRATRDELRHARLTRALARRHGGECRAPRVVKQPVRGLAEIAVENAVEGCVRETYGALVAVYQSQAAVDRRVRAAMKAIAKDETKHAALAWRIGAWIDRRLTPADRRRVADARRSAVQEIASSVDRGAPSAVRRLAGLPGRVEAGQMVEQMRTALWRC